MFGTVEGPHTGMGIEPSYTKCSFCEATELSPADVLMSSCRPPLHLLQYLLQLKKIRTLPTSYWIFLITFLLISEINLAAPLNIPGFHYTSQVLVLYLLNFQDFVLILDVFLIYCKKKTNMKSKGHLYRLV